MREIATEPGYSRSLVHKTLANCESFRVAKCSRLETLRNCPQNKCFWNTTGFALSGAKGVVLGEVIESRSVPKAIPANLAVTVPLRVPYFGKEGDAVDEAMPELESYIRSRHPQIESVRLAYRNPRPEFWSFLYQHEAWILIALLNPLTQRLAANIADDAYKWLKERFRVKRGHGKASKGKRARAKPHKKQRRKNRRSR